MHDTKVFIFLLNTWSLTVKHCHKYGDPVLRCTLYYFPFEAIPAIKCRYIENVSKNILLYLVFVVVS